MTSDAKLFDLEIGDLLDSLETISGDLPLQVQLKRLNAVRERIGKLCQIIEASLPSDIVAK